MTNRISTVKRDTTVSATALRNYVRDNGISDWLREYGMEKGYKITPTGRFSEQLCNRGINYECVVLHRIRDLLKNEPDMMVQVCKQMPQDVYKKDMLTLTQKYMQQGVAVIYQGTIHNAMEDLIGAPDFIVRSDYMKRLLNIDVPEIKSHRSLLPHGYVYYVVDAKSKNLKYMKDGCISNTNDFIHYKVQVAVYNLCLRDTLGFVPKTGYLVTPSSIGTIKLANEDIHCYNLITNACIWLRDMRRTGSKWDPTNIETVPAVHRHSMVPNLKIHDENTQEAKQQIAKQMGHISLLPFCGQSVIELAVKKGIYTYNDDRCTAENLGFKGDRAKLVNNIIQINKDSNKTRVKYDKLTDYNKNALFLDMEFINASILTYTGQPPDFSGTLVYHIGVSHRDKNRIVHKNFICDRLNTENEQRIFTELLQYLSRFGSNPVIYYWSAEETRISSIAEKYDMDFSWLNMIDLCKLCKQQQLVVKGCFSYGLKELSTCLYQNKYINSIWDVSTADRMDTFGACMASICDISRKAVLTMQSIPQIPEYRAMEEYNKIDCNVMLEIYEMLCN